MVDSKGVTGQIQFQLYRLYLLQLCSSLVFVLFVKCDFSASSISITCETLKSDMLFPCLLLLYSYLSLYVFLCTIFFVRDG